MQYRHHLLKLSKGGAGRPFTLISELKVRWAFGPIFISALFIEAVYEWLNKSWVVSQYAL